MKNFLLLLVLLLSINAYSQKKSIINPVYPLAATPIVILPNGDTTINLIIVQKYLDSLYGLLNAANATISAQATRIKNIADSNKVAYANAGLAINSISNVQASQNTLASTQTQQGAQINNHGLSITTHTNQIALMQHDIDSLETVISGLNAGTDVLPPPKEITATTYTITQADNKAILNFKNGCKVFFSNLSPNFHCYLKQGGSQILFQGSFDAKLSATKSQTKFCWVEVIVDANNIVSLKGDIVK